MVNQVYVNIKYLEKLTSTINSNTWLPEDINDYLGELQERDN